MHWKFSTNPTQSDAIFSLYNAKADSDELTYQKQRFPLETFFKALADHLYRLLPGRVETCSPEAKTHATGQKNKTSLACTCTLPLSLRAGGTLHKRFRRLRVEQDKEAHGVHSDKGRTTIKHSTSDTDQQLLFQADKKKTSRFHSFMTDGAWIGPSESGMTSQSCKHTQNWTAYGLRGE